MIGGTVPGVLLRVCRKCVRFAALCVAGAVGFVVVVIGGALLTLAIVAPPSKVGAGATLCFVGPVVANCCNALAILWINLFFGFLLSCCIDSTNSVHTSSAC